MRVIILVMLMMANTAMGLSVNVEADGSGEYPTIQDALNAVSEGDTIVLGDGIYAGTGNAGLILDDPIEVVPISWTDRRPS